MKITITGGSGRLGQAVIQYALDHGHQVINVDQSSPNPESISARVPFRQIDSTDYAQVKQALQDAEALIHLAAIPVPYGNPDYKVHNNNVVSNYNTLSAAASLGITRLCLASSINAIGGEFSRQPRYDYFPLNEGHPTYAEDPYGLSKWLCEQQADAFARRYEAMRIASLRFHWLVPERAFAVEHSKKLSTALVKHLWGYARLDAAAEACFLAITANFTGHEVFYIVAPDTTSDIPSTELHQKHYPNVPLRHELHDNQSFFDCTKAHRILGWKHPLS
jgi:nucleoside-diphosphate-sugar epimerase